MEKIAVILVETYNAKLFIANADQDNYFIMQSVESEPIKLGLEMGDDHFLKKPQIDATIRVLKNFRKICEINGVTKTIAVANLFRDSKPKNIYSFFDEVFATILEQSIRLIFQKELWLIFQQMVFTLFNIIVEMFLIKQF